MPNRIFSTLAKAEEVAAALNADSDDGWTYTVVPNPNAASTTAIIAVHDEDGVFVNYL